MNCPVCRNVQLESERLSADLESRSCRKCGGRWIQSFSYWKWLQASGGVHPAMTPAKPGEFESQDSAPGKLCPECGHFLTQRKVGHGVTFHLDRCGNCGGIWFDRNEWEALAEKGLHDDIHFVFSNAWQKEVDAEETREAYEQRIAKILGSQSYAKVTEFAKWLAMQPQKSTVLSYLAEGGK
jgi:Zn-finger nucleic acid-binding protein